MPHKIVRDYFDFSRRERTGIACLLSLIVLMHCLPYGRSYFFSQKHTTDTAGLQQAALAIDAMMVKDSARKPMFRYKPWPRRTFVHRPFEKRRDSGYTKRRMPLPVIDINHADTTQWERLPGIGPVLARRIVTFRERLGGFHAIAQVGETFGLADSVFNKIQGMLVLGEVSLRKTDLNQTDEKSLADHPYINTKLARLIIRYRNNHGPFRRPEDLKGIPLVNDSIYRKLEKYFEVK